MMINSISSSSFFVGSLEFYSWKIRSSANEAQCLIGVMSVNIQPLFSILGGNVHYFTTKYTLCKFIIDSLYHWGSLPRFFLNHEWVLTFVRYFYASIKMIICIFLFYSDIKWNALLDFWMLNQLYIPGVNSAWSSSFLYIYGYNVLVIWWAFLHVCSRRY